MGKARVVVKFAGGCSITSENSMVFCPVQHLAAKGVGRLIQVHRASQEKRCQAGLWNVAHAAGLAPHPSPLPRGFLRNNAPPAPGSFRPNKRNTSAPDSPGGRLRRAGPETAWTHTDRSEYSDTPEAASHRSSPGERAGVSIARRDPGPRHRSGRRRKGGSGVFFPVPESPVRIANGFALRAM